MKFPNIIKVIDKNKSMYNIHTIDSNPHIDIILQRKAYEIENITNPTYTVYKDLCIFNGKLKNEEVQIYYYDNGTYKKYLGDYLISKGTYLP